MSILFDPVSINNMELRNRFVRSATYDGCSDISGSVSDAQMELFKDLAEGGVGLIITGITYVHNSGQISPFQNSIADDNCIRGFSGMNAAIHDRGAKVAVQLFHAGREAARFLGLKNEEAIGPSYVSNDQYFTEKYRPAADDEIWEIVHAFGDAAGRAKEAGFDAVQVHGAHAYLLSQFLSPFTNHRDDDWGGALENRLRFHREVCRDIRSKVGDDYPVLIKIGVEDGFSGGLELCEGRQAAQYLSEWGFDALEISQGLRGRHYEGTEFRTKINRPDREAYFRNWCREVKSQVDVPVMMVGGLRTFDLMEDVVRKGEADFISLSRPLIKEPGIINSWKDREYRKPACISCNKCYEALIEGKRLHCVMSGNKGE